MHQQTSGIVRLGELLKGGGPATPKDLSESSEYLLRVGLQDALTVLCAVAAAPSFNGGAVPPGFCDAFQRALHRPTHGGLRDFVAAACRREDWPLAPETRTALASLVSEHGWLSSAVRLRNTLTHGVAAEIDEARRDLENLLEAIPSNLNGAAIRSSGSSEQVLFSVERETIPIWPLVVWKEGRAVSLSAFEQGEATFHPPAPEAQKVIRDRWGEIRLEDPLLEDPTAMEVRERLLRRAVSGPDAPWWWDRFLDSSAPATLASPEVVEGESGRVLHWNGELVASIQASPDESPMETVNRCLGVHPDSDRISLVRLVPADHAVAVLVDTSRLSWRGFLSLVHLAADLANAGSSSGVRLVLLRDREVLATEEDHLRDRVPQDLHRVLLPPGTGADGRLSAWVWPEQPSGLLRRLLSRWRPGND